jgi:hypothetical protein
LTRLACVPVNPPAELNVPAVLVTVTVPLADWSVFPSPSTALTATGGPPVSTAVPVMSVFTNALFGCVSQTSLQLPETDVTRLLPTVCRLKSFPGGPFEAVALLRQDRPRVRARGARRF